MERATNTIYKQFKMETVLLERELIYRKYF